ncbi:MAG: dihydropyrimidinase [Candidatus Hodarchaeota archaeon]
MKVTRMKYDLLIKDGKLVTSTSISNCTIGINNGKIFALHKHSIGLEGEQEIDASGNIILPGIIDPHVHFSLPVNPTLKSSDSFESGSKAAAFGGMTTFLDFTTPTIGTTLKDQLETRIEEAKSSCIDYSFHIVVTDASPTTLGEISHLAHEGFPSFKIFTTYGSRGLMLTDDELGIVFNQVKDAGGIILAHCEDESLVVENQRALIKEGHIAPEFHADARPAIAEAEAIARVALLAGNTKTKLYVVHVSTKMGLLKIRAAKATGTPIIAETCPHYLSLNREMLNGPKGHLYLMTPPLREQSDCTSLWTGLTEEVLDTIGTDHCPFYQKDKLAERFIDAPMGVMGVETLLPILYTDGVLTDRLTLFQLVKFCSENPARAFGLFPQKGALELGSDADLVLIDPKAEKIVSSEDLHMNVDYNIFEGRNLSGWPLKVISRGEIIVDGGDFVCDAHRGILLRRKGH